MSEGLAMLIEQVAVLAIEERVPYVQVRMALHDSYIEFDISEDEE